MGVVWENTTPSTELPRGFCAGIGPLQLGVVLVIIYVSLNINLIKVDRKQTLKHECDWIAVCFIFNKLYNTI